MPIPQNGQTQSKQFDHIVGLVLKGLIKVYLDTQWKLY